MYSWIPLLFTWNYHNIVNWLYSKGPSSQGYGFSSAHVWMWEMGGLWRKLRAKELMLLNCGVGEDSRVPWTARRSLLGVHWKDWYWSWNSNTLATSCEELTHWKRLWLEARGEGDGRGWDGWMASLTRWTWVWLNSGSWWWTGRPGVLRFMGSQSRIWLSNWTELNIE